MVIHSPFNFAGDFAGLHCACNRFSMIAMFKVASYLQAQQAPGDYGTKNPRSEADSFWSNGSAPARGPARTGPGRGAMRGAKRQHAAPY